MNGSDYARIAKAIAFLDAHSRQQPKLGRVAEHVGLSEFHFQRLFQRWAGISPKRFLQVQTLVDAKRLLAQSKSLLDVSLETGLSSPSRLYDLFVTYDAMTPGEFKSAQLTIAWGVHDTPLGAALFGVTERGLASLAFVDGNARDVEDAVAALRGRFPNARLEERPRASTRYADELARRFRGKPKDRVALVLHGSAFQVKVWEALLAIPSGAVTTYGELARRIGAPASAARAVGGAVGANPIAWLIPCHRVIRATGILGGYRWGEPRKRAALAAEWASALAPTPRQGAAGPSNTRSA